MEKVESIGLENIMLPPQHPPGISPLALHGTSALYTAAATGRGRSPMAQLTSLKHLRKQQQHQDDLVKIDKETIKAVLTKGLSHDSLKSMASSSGASSGISTAMSSDSDSSSVASYDSEPRTKEAMGSSATAATASPTTAARLKQMQRQKSRRNLLNGANGGSQRPDLGTVNGSNRPSVRPDLGTVANKPTAKTSGSGNGKESRKNQQQQLAAATTTTASTAAQTTKEESRSLGQSVYGTISSLLFGRKGGLL